MTIQFPNNRKEIADRMKADVQAQLPNSNPFLKNSYLGALITGAAGRNYEFYLQLSNALLEMFPDTATGSYLERWGSYVGINRNPATRASGNVVFTGVGGSFIPAGTILNSSDGLSYVTQAAATLNPSTVTVASLVRFGSQVTVTTTAAHEFATGMPVSIVGANQSGYNGTWIVTVLSSNEFTYTIPTAPTTPATGFIQATASLASVPTLSVGYGTVNNQESGAQLTLATGVAGVDNIAYVNINEISGASDNESDDDYRERVLYRYQNPVALFNVAAIKNQAFSQPGVTRVWVREAGYPFSTLDVASITRTGPIATVTTTTPHGLETGQAVEISGATPSGYNTVAKCLVLSSNTFAYVVPSSLSSPATGAITATASLAVGQVIVFFTRDNDPASPIPEPGEVAAVKNRILGIKPAHVFEGDVIVRAPTPVPINFAFSSLLPNTVSMQTAIKSSLLSLFEDQVELGTTLLEAAYLAAIWQAISSSGEQVQSFTLATPTSNIPIASDQLPILGTITWP